MKKVLLNLLLVVVIIVLTPISYAATLDLLIVKVGDNEETQIALKEKPSVTFEGNSLILTTQSETITLDGKKLINFTFANAAGVEDLKLVSKPTYFLDGSILKIYGLQPNENVSLYTIDGLTLCNGIADENGYSEIHIQSSHHIFIVNSRSLSIKFAK